MDGRRVCGRRAFPVPLRHRALPGLFAGRTDLCAVGAGADRQHFIVDDGPPAARKIADRRGHRKLAGDNAFWLAAFRPARRLGSLQLAAIMLCAYLLVRSVEYMVIAGCLTLFDNFLYVMSRIAMLDTFLMLFLFWAYLLFLAGTVTDYESGASATFAWC